MRFSSGIATVSALLVAASGCTAPEPGDPPAVEGSLAASLTRDVNNNVLMTWLEPQPGGHRLQFSRLDGADWSLPVTIAQGERFFANWADLPSVVDDGDLLYAHWLEKTGAETYAYGIRLKTSQDGGGQWSESQWIHDDTSPTEHGFVSYSRTAGGVQAFWLDGRGMVEESGPMQLRTALLRDGRVGESTVLDERVCECCATDAALYSGGTIVAYRDRSDDEIRDIRIVRSEGEGWSEPILVAEDGWMIHGCPVNGPSLAADSDVVAVGWFTAADRRPRVQAALSVDGGATFGGPILVDDERPVGRVDLAIDSESKTWVLWMSHGGFIELQSLAADGELGERSRIGRATATRAAGFPRLTATDDRLIIVWREARTLRVATRPL